MRSLRWLRYILFAIAVMALGYCGMVMSQTWLYQKRESQKLAQLLIRPPHAASGSLAIPPVTNDGMIGRIEIPRLRVSAIIAEGAGAGTLRKAVGHIEGTAFPGEPGNVGVAAHRDTFFRPLRHIRDNDLVVLDTLRGRYYYRVVSTRIVKPDAVGVLTPTAHQVLTMVTCYPFYYVGSAPYRFIVRARRVNG